MNQIPVVTSNPVIAYHNVQTDTLYAWIAGRSYACQSGAIHVFEHELLGRSRRCVSADEMRRVGQQCTP